MVEEIESKNMDKDSPILVRIFKEESELEVWKQDRTGRFALLKTYPICRWSGELGPKIKEGDRQAPEGFYNITPGQMNPNSQYYLSFDLGYPNAYRPRPRPHRRAAHGARRLLVARLLFDDRRADPGNLRARPRRLLRRPEVVPGAGLSVPDDAAEPRQASQQPEHRVLADAEEGQRPFRGQRASSPRSTSARSATCSTPSPAGPARPLLQRQRQVPGLRGAGGDRQPRCSDKERQDDVQIAELIRRGTPVAPVRTDADGGMHPVFVAAVKRNQIGVAPEALFVTTPPGTIPATVRPPRIPELADAPIVNGAAPASSPANELPVRMAITEPRRRQPNLAAKSEAKSGQPVRQPVLVKLGESRR